MASLVRSRVGELHTGLVLSIFRPCSSELYHVALILFLSALSLFLSLSLCGSHYAAVMPLFNMWAISVRGPSMRGSHVLDSLKLVRTSFDSSSGRKIFRVREMVAVLKRARPRVFLWCRWLLYYLCNLLGYGE